MFNSEYIGYAPADATWCHDIKCGDVFIRCWMNFHNPPGLITVFIRSRGGRIIDTERLGDDELEMDTGTKYAEQDMTLFMSDRKVRTGKLQW